ncbi:MAG TPA: hypothetical protein VMT30_03485 [Candidatus Saccharimonadia bacterium]|nr:hypothetical protein [Candidatus Saccharimonadia bacterium]
MTAPIKPTRTARNQPPKFDESLGGIMRPPSTLPVSPLARPAQPRLGLRQLRLLLMVVWVLAATMAGIGIGGLIRDALRPAAIGEPPVPVAQATVVARTLTAGALAVAAAPIRPDLAVSPAAAVQQARAGTPIITLAAASVQAADVSDALQPSFNHFGHAQGNIGTAPVQ